MKMLLAIALLFGFASIGGCAESPTHTASGLTCNYRSSGAGGDNADLSEQVMLPYNPYWVKYVPAGSPEIAASADDPCAGQPGHVLYAVDPSAAPLPRAVADR
jgi:hypothetical protein